jgi:multidrug resistance protein, MATE family
MRILDPELSRRVIHLAVPVVISQLSQTVVGLVDTMMVGRLGVVALGATGLAGLAVWMVMGAVGHLATGTQILASRRTGQENHPAAGRALASALQAGLPLAVLLTGLLFLLYPLYYGLILQGPADPLYQPCLHYTLWRVSGLAPFVVISALRGFFNGVGDTRQHMRVAIFINLVHIPLNWVLIFGKLGAPALGAAGAGLSAMLSTTAGCLFFLWLARRAGLGRRWGFHWRLVLKRATDPAEGPAHLLRLAAPAATQAFLVLAGFTLFIAMMRHVGTAEVAAANVIFTILSLSFMPGFGIGIAASTLIGQLLGAGRPAEAMRAGWEAQKLGMLLMSSLGLLFFAFPDPLLRLFTPNDAVIAAARWPLRLLGCFQALDALGMTTAGCLEGAGLTAFVMRVDVGLNWLVFLPLSAGIILGLGGGILEGFAALAVYLTAYALILQMAYRRGDWMRRVV